LIWCVFFFFCGVLGYMCVVLVVGGGGGGGGGGLGPPGGFGIGVRKKYSGQPSVRTRQSGWHWDWGLSQKL